MSMMNEQKRWWANIGIRIFHAIITISAWEMMGHLPRIRGAGIVLIGFLVLCVGLLVWQYPRRPASPKMPAPAIEPYAEAQRASHFEVTFWAASGEAIPELSICVNQLGIRHAGTRAYELQFALIPYPNKVGALSRMLHRVRGVSIALKDACGRVVSGSHLRVEGKFSDAACTLDYGDVRCLGIQAHFSGVMSQEISLTDPRCALLDLLLGPESETLGAPAEYRAENTCDGGCAGAPREEDAP